MNFLEKTIAAVAPKTALRRARARIALHMVEQFAYEGAGIGRGSQGWVTPGTSAVAETLMSLPYLRNRSRDLYRNNPLARSAVNNIVAKTIGTGIMPASKSEDSTTRKKLDDAFQNWAEECDADGRLHYTGQQVLGTKTIVESGECLLRYRQRLTKDKLTIPLQLQLLEPDYLDHLRTMPVDTGYILQGVQFNQIGQREGYWLFNHHPGDTANVGIFSVLGSGYTSQFIPVNQIEHGYEVERIGQVRGVPRCAPVIMAMLHLDGYQEAMRVRKKIEQCFTAFVHDAAGEEGSLTPSGQQQTKNGQLIETFEPGMIQYLPPGKDISFSDPKSSGGEDAFIRGEKRDIAAGWGIPYEILTGDLSQVNYSSYRGGLLGFKDLIELFRWNVIIPFICEPVWQRFVDYCVIQGIIQKPDYAVEWGTPKFDLLDRKEEAMADEKQIRIGTLTWPQAVAAQGLDPEKQIKAIEESNQKFDDAGIVLDCDPRRVSIQGKLDSAVAGNVTQIPIPASQPKNEPAPDVPPTPKDKKGKKK